MKTELTHHLVAALLGVALTLNLHAQTSAFTYQGQLTDNGRPANGSYDLTFSLWDTQIGSQQGGTITNLATTVSNGLFTVTLDFGASVFDGNPRSLEIGVATNGSGVFSTLSPRQPLTSTPYAVRAGNATSASSVSAANITGTINVTQLPATIITNGASGVNITGTFSGDGSAITNVDLFTINSREAITFTPNWGKFVFSSSPGVGSSPSSVAAADVNGDGKVDLISTGFGRLVVLTNNGSAGFVLSSTLTLTYGSDFVTTADVNGDGKVDLIGTIQNASALAVFTNNGSGGFILSSHPSVGSDPYAVTVADVNGDGKVDLISANNGDNTLTVLTNNGSGGFVLSSSPGVGSYPNSVAAADINGDGKVDLISANSSDNTLTVLTNNGSGGFVLASSPGVGTGPYSVAAADVNGDGKVDLISANSSDNTLTVLTNNGSGGFVLSSSPVVGGGPRSVTSADVNGDGKVDLISANTDILGRGDTLTVLTNNGSGGFVLSSSPVVGIFPQSVTAADVNGDGHVDLISANTENTLTVLLNTPASFTANFSGNGSGLTSLDAANITTGTLGDAQLSANVALLNRTSQAFTGMNTFAGNVGIGTNNPQATLHVVGSILATGEVHPTGIGMPASFGADTNYVGTPGNYIAFGDAGVSEDFIGYKNNTFYMMDSPGGADTADPNLVVGGNIKLGGSGQYYAPGGEENLRIVRGSVTAAGGIVNGAGFTASRTAAGHYTVTFSTAFSANPTITVSCGAAGQTLTSTDSASVGSADTTGFTVQIGVRTVGWFDEPFSFIAIGPR